MAEGKYDYKIDIKGNDEIGMLVQSFNTLSDELMKKI
ncbi:HAMP domain-containing protein [Peptococcaceae bacterium]|nr:HAMP domain-containing protein [Peptococcaceae bacterium]